MANEELNRLAFERDLALRQAKLARADLHVIRTALNENRPLEALYTVNNSVERLDEELDAIEEDFPNETPEEPRSTDGVVSLKLDEDDCVSAFSVREMAEDQFDQENIGNAQFLEAVADELEGVDDGE